MINPKDINIEFDQLVRSIYQGITDTIPWKKFIPQLGLLMEARAVSLILRPPTIEDSGLIINYQRSSDATTARAELANPTDWQVSAYTEYFFSLDPFVNLPTGDVFTLSELLPDNQLLESDYYKQYLRPADVFRIIGTDIAAPGGVIARLRISRSQSDANFNNIDKQLIILLIPHLLQAIQLHTQLNNIESERALYANVVDQLSVNTIILNENKKILSCNTKASELLNQKDGISRHGQLLHFNTREQTHKFHKLVDLALKNQHKNQPGIAEAMNLSRPSGRADLGLVVRPIPISEWSEGQQCPSVAIFISDPEQHSNASQNIISRLFGFTPAEASLTMLITRGKTLAEAAKTQGVSQHTARTHLKSIFSKTGVSRQAELVRCILKSVADLG